MINLYKSISENILEIVNEKEFDEKQLSNELNKRQDLINSLHGKELDEFRKSYKSQNLNLCDEKIKQKLKEHMIEVKKELNDYKLNKSVNTTYANMNKNNLNIFSRKV